ncbi:hypothetical protein BV22DRAFT_1026806 [Leucogyrophana mollusca]|uniref:Uncharacterized protein n=1 Tax=Leucogyrophana mollusca TaxID=85980 RepID=A0ACB8AVL5_9AGAM|nr:hypothetical protein BV22DRAFT_1026806 [Leucogyrophana mollusca]
MLINPTGKAGKFRAVDWCVELNNLFIKVKNGGKGSNRTVARIILESPLVQIYRNTHSNIEKNFMHSHLTFAHTEPDMTKTLHHLTQNMKKQSPHQLNPGRQSSCSITDLLDKGQELFDKKVDTEGTDEPLERPEVEDIVGELD